MTNTRLTDVEVIERRYPVRIREFSIRRGSGGQGQHRGGDGIVRRIEFLKPLRVSMLSERRGPYPPFGLEGGQPGQCGRNTLEGPGSRVEGQGTEDASSAPSSSPSVPRPSTLDPRPSLGGKFSIDVHPGDILTIETPGGGGSGETG